MTYDPIPDLALLLAAVLRARRGRRRDDGTARARLTEGLGLPVEATADEAEAAIRAALASFTTRTGHLITPAEIAGWVTEAERGYEVPAGHYRDAAGLHRQHDLHGGPHDQAPPPHPELGPDSGHQLDGPEDCRRCQMIRDNQHWMGT